MFVLIENGAVAQYPYSLAQLQQANPNVSFARGDDAAYEAFGMFRVYTSELPPYSELTQRLVEDTPVFNEQVQRWLQSWQVVALSVEEIAEREASVKAANEAQAKQLLLDSDWADLPSVRNTALTPHLVNAADFDAYRVALRAIAINPPVTVDPWPTRPDAVWSTE